MSNLGVWGALCAPPKSNLVHFSLKILHGGNNFNYFPENQLNKFKLCPPQLPYFCPLPREFLRRILRRRGCFWTPLLRSFALRPWSTPS